MIAMWSSFVLAAAVSLTPAQPGGGLQLNNARLTYGELGPTRKDSRLIPGDVLFIAYDIEGISIGNDGIAKYSMAMEVADASGKTIFKQAPRDLEEVIPLRGFKIPARAFIQIGLDQDPGMYTCKLSVTDPKMNRSNSLAVKFEVLKPEFAIVAVRTAYDPRGELNAPSGGVVGQPLFILFVVATFQRDPKTKQPHVEITYEFLDDKGQPTLPQPKKDVQDALSPRIVGEKDGAFQKDFLLFLNRPGKFTVRITATDKIGNKKSTFDLPVTILPAL